MDRELTEPLPVSEQAAAWFFELADGPNDESTRQEFVRWLKRSPEHIDAFLGIALLERELAGLPADIEQALAVAGEGGADVVPLAARAPAGWSAGLPIADEPAPRRQAPRLRRPAWLAAAAMAVLAVSVGVWLAPRPTGAPQPIVHRTDYGEQRSIALADGSIVVLNTLSEIVVRFGKDGRRVELVAGEAMFDVASDPERPFVVEAGVVDLSVLGTRFSVYRQPDSVRLAVAEGVVRAEPHGQPGRHVLVHAGEGAVASTNGAIRRNERIDLEKALAWTERRLIFDDVPLADVVAEFNRYNRRPLIVQDPALAERKITSVFFANDVSALVAFLELEPDVEVDYGADAIRIRSED